MLERDLKNTHISDNGGNQGLKRPELPPQDNSAPRTLADQVIDQSQNVLNYNSNPEESHLNQQARYPYPDERTPGPTIEEIQKQSSKLESKNGDTKYANYQYSSLVDPVIDDSKVKESEMKINQYAQQKKYEETQREMQDSDTKDSGSGGNFLKKLSNKNKDDDKASTNDKYETYYDENRDSYVSTTGRQTDVKTRHTGIDPGMDSSAAGNYTVNTQDMSYGNYQSQDPKIIQKNVATGYDYDDSKKYNANYKENLDVYDNYPEDIKQQQRKYVPEESTHAHEKHDGENGGLLSTIGTYLGIKSDGNEEDNLNQDKVYKNTERKEPTDMPGGLAGNYETNPTVGTVSSDNSNLQSKNVANTNAYKDNLESRTGVVETVGVVGAPSATNTNTNTNTNLQRDHKLFQSDLSHPSGTTSEKNYQNAEYHHNREELQHRGALKDNQRRRSYEEEAADLKAAMAYSGGKSPNTTTHHTFDNTKSNQRGTHEGNIVAGDSNAQYNTSGGVLLAGSAGAVGVASGNKVDSSAHRDVTTDLKTESTPYRMTQNPENKKYLQEKDTTGLKSDKTLLDDRELARDSSNNRFQGETGGNAYLSNTTDSKRPYGQSYTSDGIDTGVGYAKAGDEHYNKGSTIDTSKDAKISRNAGYEDFDKLAGGESTDPPQITEDGGYYAGTRSRATKSLSGSDFNESGTNESKAFVRNSEGRVPRERNNETGAFITSDNNNSENLKKQGHRKSASSSSSGGLGDKIKKVLGVDKKKHDDSKDDEATYTTQKGDAYTAGNTGAYNSAGTYGAYTAGGSGDAYQTSRGDQAQMKYSNTSGAYAGNPQYETAHVPRSSGHGDSFHRNEGYTLREGQEQANVASNQDQHRKKSLVETIKKAF